MCDVIQGIIAFQHTNNDDLHVHQVVLMIYVTVLSNFAQRAPNYGGNQKATRSSLK